MTCDICGKPATKMAGKLGFCTAHKDAAVKATVALGSRKTGIGIQVYPRKVG